MSRKFVLCALLLAMSTFSGAQERHFIDAESKALFSRSEFAHAYIHGYERGFHSGDIDLQVGRPPRDPAKLPQFRRANEGFDSKIGPKDMWKAGFRDGFLTGYGDAVHLLSFRAVNLLRRAAAGISPSKAVSRVFDHAFRDGYEMGRGHGTQDAKDAANFDPIVPPCMQLPGDSCDGFERGFGLGYADGFVSLEGRQTNKVEVAAQK